jgi:alkaline phosphatase
MLHFVSDNIKEEPTLAHMTRVALGVLKKNEKGFFLLVEGGRIAHAAHANMTGKMIREILAFDEAVGEVLGFLQSNPDTLLIITSNLEVGGPVLSKKVWDEKYVLKQDFKQILDDTKELIIWPTRNHTATPAIVFAKGPGSEGVTGVHDNTYLMKIMETEVPVVQVKEEITETTGQEQKELWIKEPKKTPVEIKGQKNEIQEIKKPGPDNEIKKHRRKKR